MTQDLQDLLSAFNKCIASVRCAPSNPGDKRRGLHLLSQISRFGLNTGGIGALRQMGCSARAGTGIRGISRTGTSGK